MITGDALVTRDPYTGAIGPRLVARAATGDVALARASLDAIAATHAQTVLPGHGGPWREGATRAAELARDGPESCEEASGCGHDGRVDARTVRRRRLTALGAVALVAVAGGIAAGAGGGAADDSGSGDGASAKKTTAPDATPKPAQLPGGGRQLFPDRRVVAFYGNPRDDELGALGIGTPAQAAKRLVKQAKPYNLTTRPVLPAMELISTVATAAPGDAGLYRDHISFAKIRSYLAAARKIDALLILDIQPGRGEFGPEITRLAPFLREPDVGLALDPEWHVAPDALPGKVIGLHRRRRRQRGGYLPRQDRARAQPAREAADRPPLHR